VQIGFREKDFPTNTIEANLRAIGSEIKKAREKTKGNHRYEFYGCNE